MPPKTPDEIVNKLADAFKQVNETPEYKEMMESMGFQMVFTDRKSRRSLPKNAQSITKNIGQIGNEINRS